MCARGAVPVIPADELARMAESGAPRIIADWLDIAAVAAPLGAEHDRAELIAAKLAGISALAGVEVSSGPDAEGPNVYARLPGTGGGQSIAGISTLDDLDTIAALRQRPGM